MVVKSKFTKRSDGRKFDELREMDAKVGIIPSADGSAMFRSGSTIAIAAVFGPRILHPQHMQDPKKGLLRVNYNMMSFSVNDRIRPGLSKRSQEISKVTEWALLPCCQICFCARKCGVGDAVAITIVVGELFW